MRSCYAVGIWGLSYKYLLSWGGEGEGWHLEYQGGFLQIAGGSLTSGWHAGVGGRLPYE